MGELTLIMAVEEYRDIYLAYRNFAQRTRGEYVNDLHDLVKFLKRMKVDKVGEVRLPHLIQYMAELERRGFAGSTRKRKVISIRSFFSYMYIEDNIASNISKQLIVLYVEPQTPR
jgi:site-specific recombinase XerD